MKEMMGSGILFSGKQHQRQLQAPAKSFGWSLRLVAGALLILGDNQACRLGLWKEINNGFVPGKNPFVRGKIDLYRVKMHLQGGKMDLQGEQMHL